MSVKTASTFTLRDSDGKVRHWEPDIIGQVEQIIKRNANPKPDIEGIISDCLERPLYEPGEIRSNPNWSYKMSSRDAFNDMPSGLRKALNEYTEEQQNGKINDIHSNTEPDFENTREIMPWKDLRPHPLMVDIMNNNHTTYRGFIPSICEAGGGKSYDSTTTRSSNNNHTECETSEGESPSWASSQKDQKNPP